MQKMHRSRDLDTNFDTITLFKLVSSEHVSQRAILAKFRNETAVAVLILKDAHNRKEGWMTAEFLSSLVK